MALQAERSAVGSQVSLRRRSISLRCSAVSTIGFMAKCLPCLMFQLAVSSTPRCCTRRFSFGDGIELPLGDAVLAAAGSVGVGRREDLGGHLGEVHPLGVDVLPRGARPPPALLGLALLRPFLRDLLGDAEDLVGEAHASPPITRADLPRSVYSTRGWARCSTNTTGSSAVALSLASVVSSPSPVLPKDRNGFLIAALQFAPVKIRRRSLAPGPSQPNADSSTHGTSGKLA